MSTVKTSTIISAPPERVWEILTDFGSYPSWNPFVKSISGVLEVGTRLAVRIAPSGGNGMAFKPIITELREAAVLEWLGHFLIPGIFDGRHRFELVGMTDGTTVFRQSENFTGIMIPFVGSLLKESERGFAAFNVAIKARSEAAQAPSLAGS
jgi:hypothetical protein